MKYESSSILAKIRGLFSNSLHVPEHLSAYIVPSEDAHSSEYIAACDERRAFVCGFNGSRGLSVVTDKAAAMWTDGRYFLHARQQMDDNWILMKEGVDGTPTMSEWLGEQLQPGAVVGIDPYLVTRPTFKMYEEGLAAYDLRLIPVSENLVDIIWGSQQPARPRKPIISLDVKYTGMSSQEKIHNIRLAMKRRGAVALLVSALDEVAWLFNLRGSDIDYNPVFFSYALITTDRVVLYVDSDKLDKESQKSLNQCDVQVNGYRDIMADLGYLKEHVGKAGGKIWVPNTTSFALSSIFADSECVFRASPIVLMKAKKNATELQGMRDAHVRDSAAHCEFLHWLEGAMKKSNHGLTEISVASKFLKFRQEQDKFMGLSFHTISSVGPNAAINHYEPSPETDTPLSTSQVYLVDSGGQYLDGTTDITRTVMFREPPPFVRDCFTRVLKGHIALAALAFPAKTSGYRLDSLARTSLWQVGLDFKHGTGHGIGHFLNVHEGPAGFHWRKGVAEDGIEAGMVLTVEPGYYHDGEFGIRIENAYEVVEKATPPFSKDNKFLAMEPLTLVPISHSMLDPALLTNREIEWLNEYHQLVENVVGSYLKEQGKHSVFEWLVRQTAPLN